jgi:DNA-binding NtrC family response regulator
MGRAGATRVWVVDADEAGCLAGALSGMGLAARALAPDEVRAAWSRGERCDVLVVDHDALDVEGRGASPLADLGLPQDGPAIVELAGFEGDAWDATRRGVAGYLKKPAADEDVAAAVARADEARRLKRDCAQLRAALEPGDDYGQCSRDPRLHAQLERVRSVQDARVAILLEGESGTGKTRLARAIHQRSARAKKPFVEVNCGALSGDLLDSELFGHAKGAFTGALAERAGRFEAADGGTLFLDEVASASPALQVKLLRVLQDMVYERVGDDATRKVDVRIIAASNSPLKDEVAAGRFRPDLHWRLRQAHLTLPPLRERRGDLPLLAARLVLKLSAEHGLEPKPLSNAALERVCAHDWPGNVRELEHVLQAALFYARGERIEPVDLELEGAGEAAHAASAGFRPGVQLRELMDEQERAILRAALLHCGGNKSETARMLGIDRTTLFNKLRRHGLVEFGRQAG